MPKRFAILVVALVAAGCNEPDAPPPESGAADPPAQLPPDPFGPNPRHPAEVVRLMKLLPGIPAGGSPEDIYRYLGLRVEDVKDGESSGLGFTAIWHIATNYRFVLGFSRPHGDPVFSEASIQALNPGGGSHDYWILYPYRHRSGMVAK
jgi:hypothetical protein